MDRTPVQEPAQVAPVEDKSPKLKDEAPSCVLPISLPDHMDNVERDLIQRALAKTNFNRTQAAELLGISFRQLRYRMQRLNIHEPE
jgi:two-component system response regulator PilR (NtrC family)